MLAEALTCLEEISQFHALSLSTRQKFVLNHVYVLLASPDCRLLSDLQNLADAIGWNRLFSPHLMWRRCEM